MTAEQHGHGAPRRAWALYRAGDYQAALTDFTAALDADTSDYQAVHGSGRCRRMLGDYEGAAADFGRAAALRPGTAQPLCERGAIRILQHTAGCHLLPREGTHRPRADPG
ncbi:MAG TPA: tetratricopeptide repeat protein [Streptosporangiaceae bacterium]